MSGIPNRNMAKILKTWISFFLVLTLPNLEASPRFSFGKFKVDYYPTCKIELRRLSPEFAPKDHFQITETIGKTKRVVTDWELREEARTSPVDFYLSVPSFKSPEERYWILQFSASIARQVEKAKGKLYLHVQSDEDFFLIDNLNAEKMSTAFALPGGKESQYPIRSLEKLVELIPKESESLVLVVLWQDKSLDQFRAKELGESIKNKFPLFVYGRQNNFWESLGASSSGKFYPTDGEKSFAKLNEDIQAALSPKWLLTYKTPWDLTFWQTESVVVEVQYLEEMNIQFEYMESPKAKIIRWFKDPFLFFPIGIFLIVVSFSLLYYLHFFERTNSAIDNSKSKTPTSKMIETEDNIYQRLYGSSENEKKLASPNNKWNSLPIEVNGPEYSYGSLYQRIGLQSGSLYNLDKEIVLLGRGEGCDIVVWDAVLEREHAKIKRIKGKFILFDLATELGVLLNGKKLLRPKALQDLDEIQLGRTIFSFRGR